MCWLLFLVSGKTFMQLQQLGSITNPLPSPPASLKSCMNIVPAQAGTEGESIATRKGEITFFLQFSHYDLMKNIVKLLNHPNTRRPAVKKKERTTKDLISYRILTFMYSEVPDIGKFQTIPIKS